MLLLLLLLFANGKKVEVHGNGFFSASINYLLDVNHRVPNLRNISMENLLRDWPLLLDSKNAFSTFPRSIFFTVFSSFDVVSDSIRG